MWGGSLKQIDEKSRKTHKRQKNKDRSKGYGRKKRKRIQRRIKTTHETMEGRIVHIWKLRGMGGGKAVYRCLTQAEENWKTDRWWWWWWWWWCTYKHMHTCIYIDTCIFIHACMHDDDDGWRRREEEYSPYLLKPVVERCDEWLGLLERSAAAHLHNWFHLGINRRTGQCGAAMRAMKRRSNVQVDTGTGRLNHSFIHRLEK